MRPARETKTPHTLRLVEYPGEDTGTTRPVQSAFRRDVAATVAYRCRHGFQSRGASPGAAHGFSSPRPPATEKVD
jgi:hypothetical protein